MKAFDYTVCASRNISVYAESKEQADKILEEHIGVYLDIEALDEETQGLFAVDVCYEDNSVFVGEREYMGDLK